MCCQYKWYWCNKCYLLVKLAPISGLLIINDETRLPSFTGMSKWYCTLLILTFTNCSKGCGGSRGQAAKPGRSDGSSMVHLPWPQAKEAKVGTRAREGGTKPVAKLLCYGGKEPLDNYLIQVCLATRHNDWSGEDTAVHMALALEGKVLQAFLSLTSAKFCGPIRDDRAVFRLAAAHGGGEGGASEPAKVGGQDLGELEADLQATNTEPWQKYRLPTNAPCHHCRVIGHFSHDYSALAP